MDVASLFLPYIWDFCLTIPAGPRAQEVKRAGSLFAAGGDAGERHRVPKSLKEVRE
jgi:hypothetical protein